MHDSPAASDIRVGIEGVDNYRNVREIHVEPYTSKLVEFQTPSLLKGSYKLIAEGLSGIPFRKDIPLHFLNKNATILIQSDKAIYKPNDLIRFRILALDEHTKPLTTAIGINIYLTDGDNNRIKQWKNVQPNRGVFTDELQLTSSPVYGNWHINVEANGEVCFSQ